MGLSPRIFIRKVGTAARLVFTGDLETLRRQTLSNAAVLFPSSQVPGLAEEILEGPISDGESSGDMLGDEVVAAKPEAIQESSEAPAPDADHEIDPTEVIDGDDFPGILIATLPKTGTVFLQTSLCKGLGRPQLNLPSGGLFPHANIPHEAINRLNQEGGIFVMHCAPNAWNFVEVRERLDRFVIHLRDPRQALISWSHYVIDLITQLDPVQGKHFDMPDKYLDWDFSRQLDWQIDNYYPYQIEWIEGWVELARKLTPKTKVLFTTQEDLAADQVSFFDRLLDFYEIPREKFTYPQLPKAGEMNYRAGQASEWQQKMSWSQIERTTALIPEPLFERFGWPDIGVLKKAGVHSD